MYTSENNWYYYYYQNFQPFSRQLSGLKFNTHYSEFKGETKSFHDELRNAAKSILLTYPSLTPNILFSGGVDSEVVVRTFLDIGVKPKVTIFRYLNDYNIYDVSYAVVICNMLNLSYKIIDFDLEKFYEQDAEKISELAQIDRPRALPQCKFIEYIENNDLPIMGLGDLSLNRTNDDYSVKGTWVCRCWEFEIGYDKYARFINRPAVVEFFKWTPGLVLAFLNLNWCKKLINDEYYGKLGIHSTKLLGYRETFPDLIARKKQTGFESVITITDEFEKTLYKKYNGLPYRQTVDRTIPEFYDLITKKAVDKNEK